MEFELQVCRSLDAVRDISVCTDLAEASSVTLTTTTVEPRVCAKLSVCTEAPPRYFGVFEGLAGLCVCIAFLHSVAFRCVSVCPSVCLWCSIC